MIAGLSDTGSIGQPYPRVEAVCHTGSLCSRGNCRCCLFADTSVLANLLEEFTGGDMVGAAILGAGQATLRKVLVPASRSSRCNRRLVYS
jgi:hypothetical protein